MLSRSCKAISHIRGVIVCLYEYSECVGVGGVVAFSRRQAHVFLGGGVSRLIIVFSSNDLLKGSRIKKIRPI